MNFQPVITPLRNAVVTYLNGLTLTPLGTAQAVYDIYSSAATLIAGNGLLIVCPATLDPKIASRGGGQQRSVSIDVCLQYKLSTQGAAANIAELDPYMNEVEAIHAWSIDRVAAPADAAGNTAGPVTLAYGTPAKGATARQVSYPHGAFLDQHMAQYRVFTSVLRVAFQVYV